MATMKTLWIALALLSILLVDVRGQDCTNTSFNTPPPESSTIYSIPGKNVYLTAFISGTTMLLYKGPNTAIENIIDCSVNSRCTLDQNSGKLTFHDFQPSNASNYTIRYNNGINTHCLYKFALEVAVAPSLTDGTLSHTIDADTGPLTLQPMVDPGTPPAEVHWYMNDQNISIGNTFTFNTAKASDRGIYTANISNLAGSANLSYTIKVNFNPIITLEISQTGPSSYDISCRAIVHPQIQNINLFEIRPDGSLMNLHANVQSSTSNQISSNLDYEGTITYSGTDNCPKNYRCMVNTSYSSGTNNTGTCLTTPNVTNLQVNETQSTSTSAYLFWTLEPNGILVDEYEFQYRLSGQNENDWEGYSSSNCQSPPGRYCIIHGLSPGNLYEFRVTATNSIGAGATSDVQSFHTFSAPQDRPREVVATRTSVSGMDTITLSWQGVPSSSYAQVSSYQVVYNTSANSTETSVDIGDTNTYQIFNVNPDHTYFMRVRAKNMWGLGPYSALVESMKTNISDPNEGRVTVNTIVEVSDTAVVVSWTLTGESHVVALTINIDQISIQTSSDTTTVSTTRIYSYDVPNRMSGRKCFIGFDSSSVYNFCVTATANNGLNSTDCIRISTTSDNTDVVTDTSSCQDIQPFSGGTGLPAYGIGLIVACSVLLVFFGFGGCGLYFGIKRNKKGGADFDSPHPSVDDVNGYPYHSKSSSSSRSCMSYRHNQQHQHGLEWRTTNPLGRQESAVVTVV